MPVYCRWFDIDKDRYTELDESDPNPDPRTSRALEDLIDKTHAAGGMVHLWMWGDNDGNHRQTPMRDDWGGKDGRADMRLQRYIAARLGPVAGWTMGYGFDLESWVTEDDLRTWHEHMHGRFGWPHLLGGRAGSPGRDGALALIYDGLDYAGYTHFRPGPKEYREAFERQPARPVLSEDRFRIRNSERHAGTDYTPDMTRRGMWHSMMAGGVGNIWGCYGERRDTHGRSLPYPNREQIRTWSRFWAGRYDAGATPGRWDEGCLRLACGREAVVYRESCESVSLKGLGGSRYACAVDTCAPYEELRVSVAADGSVRLPRKSDWAVVVRKDQ